MKERSFERGGKNTALDRREFLKGAAAMLGAAIFAGNAAEATSLLEKAASQDEKEGEKGPKLSFELFFSAHFTGADKRGVAEKIKNADIFIPERPGWDKHSRVLYQAVANGEISPSEFAKRQGLLEDPVYGNEGSFLGTIRALYGTRVRVEFLDIPEGHPLDRQMLEMEEKITDIDLLNEDFPSLVEKFKEHLKEFSRVQVMREEYILRQLDVLANDVRKGKFPNLMAKHNVRILLAFGAIHTGLFRALSGSGNDVRRSFSRMPFIFGYGGEAVRRFMLEKDVPEELAARATMERIITPAMLARLPGSESQPKVAFIRKAVANLSREDLDALFKKLQEKSFELFQAGEVIKTMLKAKGIEMPLTREELEKALR